MHSEPAGEIYCGEKASHDGVNNSLMNFFTNDKLSAVEDCAMFSIGKGRLAFSTDSIMKGPVFLWVMVETATGG